MARNAPFFALLPPSCVLIRQPLLRSFERPAFRSTIEWERFLKWNDMKWRFIWRYAVGTLVYSYDSSDKRATPKVFVFSSWIQVQDINNINYGRRQLGNKCQILLNVINCGFNCVEYRFGIRNGFFRSHLQVVRFLLVNISLFPRLRLFMS